MQANSWSFDQCFCIFYVWLKILDIKCLCLVGAITMLYLSMEPNVETLTINSYPFKFSVIKQLAKCTKDACHGVNRIVVSFWENTLPNISDSKNIAKTRLHSSRMLTSATVAVCRRGVSAQGGVCLGGCVCPWGGGCLPRGVSAWGCLPGGVCPGWVSARHPPCGQNDRDV